MQNNANTTIYVKKNNVKCKGSFASRRVILGHLVLITVMGIMIPPAKVLATRPKRTAWPGDG
jgi:hypothetical protein